MSAAGAAIARVAALVADPSRARMLEALMSGLALTAHELADEAGVTASTASSHLALLLEARLLSVVPQGRHRYYRLADDEVAAALEQIGAIALGPDRFRRRPGPDDAALRAARVCYDHVAGAAGVRIFRSLVAQRAFELGAEGVGLAPGGHALLDDLGIDLARAESPRVACRLCLDWSERLPHLGGAAGAAILAEFLRRDWVRRDRRPRVLLLTPRGQQALDRHFPDEQNPGARARIGAAWLPGRAVN